MASSYSFTISRRAFLPSKLCILNLFPSLAVVLLIQMKAEFDLAATNLMSYLHFLLHETLNESYRTKILNVDHIGHFSQS